MTPDYEAWRAALAAFYSADCCFQSAENVKRGAALTNADRRIIDALILAGERMPKRKAA
jgi:hypothetical protein